VYKVSEEIQEAAGNILLLEKGFLVFYSLLFDHNLPTVAFIIGAGRDLLEVCGIINLIHYVCWSR
jgi:hypothetical protein